VPPLCPLSNTQLDSLELLPAPDVRAQLLIALALQHGDVDSEGQCIVAIAEPPPPPSCPPPEVVRRRHAAALALVWATPHGVLCIAQLMLNSNSTLLRYGDANFPLLNLGRACLSQPWRPVTSLFVSSSPVNVMVNCVTQLVLIWLAIVGTPRMSASNVCALFLFSGYVGNMAAGLVLPEQPLNSGYLMTGVIAMYVLAVSRPLHTSVIVGATAAATVSAVASLAGGADVASHVVASIFCAFLYQALAGSRPRTGRFGVLVMCLALFILECAALSAAPSWLQHACAPQLDFGGVF